MKINSFKAENVHGYLKYDISFYSELTFLIGINGSGKTSALKLILGLMSPSYQYLNAIEYDSIELICSSNSNEQDIIIKAVQNKKNNTFSISLKAMDFTEKPQAFPRLLKSLNEFDNEEMTVKERSYREQFDSNEITRAIRQIATPKFLGLDRRIYEGKNIDTQLKRSRLIHAHKYRRRYNFGVNQSNAIDYSLEDVQFLIYDYFRVIAQEQPKISEEFKRKIFELSFKYNEDTKLPSEFIDVESLLEKKENVLKAIRELDLNFLNDPATLFFKKIEKLIKDKTSLEQRKTKNKKEDPKFYSDDFELIIQWINNNSQLKRIFEIIDFSQTYQEKIADLRSPIRRLENILSKFLKEGNKRIEIAEDGDIKVYLNNSTQGASVYELSSGEKQIIIMIAHLIFEEDQKPSGVFIIDEPELSLHIAWQQIFIDAITEASPKTQFILATHSPSIISKVSREQYCQDLNKLNIVR